MSRAAALLGAVAFAAVAAAGCGGASSDYAGLSREAALEQAAQAAYSATSDRSDALYGHRLRLVSLVRGRNLAGDRAWFARYEDVQTGDRLCVWVNGHLLGSDTNVRPCPPSSGPPPLPPQPPPPPPAA